MVTYLPGHHGPRTPVPPASHRSSVLQALCAGVPGTDPWGRLRGPHPEGSAGLHGHLQSSGRSTLCISADSAPRAVGEPGTVVLIRKASLPPAGPARQRSRGPARGAWDGARRPRRPASILVDGARCGAGREGLLSMAGWRQGAEPGGHWAPPGVSQPPTSGRSCKGAAKRRPGGWTRPGPLPSPSTCPGCTETPREGWEWAWPHLWGVADGRAWRGVAWR